MDIASADIIGSAGVSLLLAAFALNLAGRLETGSAFHSALNMIGAGLAALAPFLRKWPLGIFPFITIYLRWSCLVIRLGPG